MIPTEACERLTSDDVLCANEAAQATGSVLCGLKTTGLPVIPLTPGEGQDPTPFYVSIVEDGGLSQLKNLETSTGLVNDSQATNATSNWSIISLLKGLFTKGVECLAKLTSMDVDTSSIAIDASSIATSNYAISGKLPATLGQKVMASSLAVTVASDQSAIPSLDAGPSWISRRGINSDGEPLSSADITAGLAITQAPVSPSNKLVITDVIISCGTDDSIVELFEETSLKVIQRIFIGKNQTVQVTLRSKTKLNVANKRLMAKTTVAADVTIQAFYYEEL